MAEEVCRSCGWVLGSSAAACPACGAALAAGEPGGAETRFFPETLAGPPSGSAAPVAERHAATVLLRPERVASRPRPVELKLQAVLIRKGGPRGNERLQLPHGASVVGREGGEVTIDDPALSARHFVIEERGQEYFLRDLGSTNGTFLNGHRVRSAKLSSGDTILAGQTSFVFRTLQVVPCD